MGLSAINGQYLGLNGLSGYGATLGFGGSYSLYAGTNTEAMKNNIASAYDVSATSTSYSQKANASSASFAQQCQTIHQLLQEGRSDEAMKVYNKLYQDMAGNSYYSSYSDNEIKTAIQEQYMNANDTTLVSDISNNAQSEFGASLSQSIPIFGLLSENASKDEFTAKATGTNTSNASKVEAVLGTLAGSAGSGAVGAAVGAAIGARGGHTKGGAIIGAIVGAASSLITSITTKAIKSR